MNRPGRILSLLVLAALARPGALLAADFAPLLPAAPEKFGRQVVRADDAWVQVADGKPPFNAPAGSLHRVDHAANMDALATECDLVLAVGSCGSLRTDFGLSLAVK